MEVLIRQGKVQHDIGLERFNEGHECIDVIRVHLSRLDFRLRRTFQLLLEGIAFRLRPRSNQDFPKCIRILAALVDGHTCHTAADND